MNAPGAAVPSDRVKMLAEEIPKLNLLEVNDLMKLLQVLHISLSACLLVFAQSACYF